MILCFLSKTRVVGCFKLGYIVKENPIYVDWDWNINTVLSSDWQKANITAAEQFGYNVLYSNSRWYRKSASLILCRSMGIKTRMSVWKLKDSGP